MLSAILCLLFGLFPLPSVPTTQPVSRPTDGPEIEFTPTSLDLGSFLPREVAPVRVTLKNQSDHAVILENYGVEGGRCGPEEGWTPKTLQPGESCVVSTFFIVEAHSDIVNTEFWIRTDKKTDACSLTYFVVSEYQVDSPLRSNKGPRLYFPPDTDTQSLNILPNPGKDVRIVGIETGPDWCDIEFSDTRLTIIVDRKKITEIEPLSNMANGWIVIELSGVSAKLLPVELGVRIPTEQRTAPSSSLRDDPNDPNTIPDPNDPEPIYYCLCCYRGRCELLLGCDCTWCTLLPPPLGENATCKRDPNCTVQQPLQNTYCDPYPLPGCQSCGGGCFDPSLCSSMCGCNHALP